MSGNLLWMLIEAEDREESLETADGEIESWFENGTLIVGDKGYVTAIEYPNTDDTVLHASDDLEKFIGELLGIEQCRRDMMKSYLKQAVENAGTADFNQYQLEEDDQKFGMVGHYLMKAGRIMGGYVCPEATLYIVDSGEVGICEADLKAIRENPGKWWLIETVVG